MHMINLGLGILSLSDGSKFELSWSSKDGIILSDSSEPIFLLECNIPSLKRGEIKSSIHVRRRIDPVLFSLLAILAWYVAILITDHDSEGGFIASMVSIMGSGV